jgi:diadenosine tetraphosphate (Ap4A) HIT family hydrolase
MSIFAQKSKSEWLYENQHYFVIEDGYPVSFGHMLIVSKREVVDYFELTKEEQLSLVEVISEAKKLLESKHSPDGYNIGFNCGSAAGQTVMHFHCHVIPRYQGDTPNPRGGIRNCIPGKGDY